MLDLPDKKENPTHNPLKTRLALSLQNPPLLNKFLLPPARNPLLHHPLGMLWRIWVPCNQVDLGPRWCLERHSGRCLRNRRRHYLMETNYNNGHTKMKMRVIIHRDERHLSNLNIKSARITSTPRGARGTGYVSDLTAILAVFGRQLILYSAIL